MIIAGLQKLTLLDYPGRVACTVFLPGCNYRCPFCHNSGLLDGSAQPELTQQALLAFLEKRRGLLDGVCVTGGEPTLSPQLPQLLRQIKSLGYRLKLDTNGSRPDVLKALVADGLVDYVAMDIKNSPARYAETSGCDRLNLSAVEQSITYLLSGGVDFEFRTTVASPLHDAASVAEMGAWVSTLGLKPKRFFLQPYVHRDSVLCPGLTTPEKAALLAMQTALAPYAETVTVRGTD